jgi:hypothetical protein
MSHVHICPYCNQILDDRDEIRILVTIFSWQIHLNFAKTSLPLGLSIKSEI